MRKLLSTNCILLTVLSALPAWGGPNPAALPKVLPTRQTVFTLPFTVAPPRNPQKPPRAVQLMLSRDRGATWQQVSQVEPTAGMFEFRAAEDGVYWFRVQTINHAGKVVSQKKRGPELRVLVDTTQPQLRLTANRTPNGRLEVQWRVQDAHPDPKSIILEYQAGEGASWRPLNIDTTTIQQQTGLIKGNQSWQIDGMGKALVRATVRDKTGNQAIAQIGAQATGTKPDPATSIGSVSPPITRDAEQDNRVAGRIPTAPDGTVPRYVKSTSFPLDYNVPPTPGVGILKIDLWATRDNGKSWTHHGTDLDRMSPFPVTVPSDGLYGFWLVVYRTNGLRDALPKSGDRPQVWIDVQEAKQPGQQSPEQQQPNQQPPNQQLPVQQPPVQQPPVQQPPVQQPPVQQPPGQQPPGQQQPVQQPPGQQQPVQQWPSLQLPIQQPPAQQLPSQNLPGQQPPVQQLPNWRLPGQSLPVQQSPAQQSPAQQSPVQQPPAQQWPAQQWPAQQWPSLQ